MAAYNSSEPLGVNALGIYVPRFTHKGFWKDFLCGCAEPRH